MGAYKIADHLRKNNITVQVIDYIHMMDSMTIVNYVRKFLPKDKTRRSVLGLSTTFFYVENNLMPKILINALAILKAEYPELKTVAGGAHAHQLRRKDNFIDFAVYSYAEDVSLELISGLLQKTQLNPDFKINRKLFKDNTEFDITKDIHTWAPEDCIRPDESLPLEISRGCIFKCRFCRYPYIGKKKNDYIKCIDNIKQEMIDNFVKYRTTKYYILDDTFNETPEKVKEFRDMVQSLPFKISWVGYLRVDLIERYPETVAWLKESGLVGAFFGIESFHPEASKVVGKAFSGKKAKEFLVDLKQNIWGNDVNITVSLIIGIPGEDLAHAKETNRWLIANGIDSWSWHLLALNNNPKKADASEFERNPGKYGITINGNDWHNGYHSRKEVTTWFKELKKETLDSVQKPSNWRSIEYAQWYDLNMVIRQPLDSYAGDIGERKTKWFQQYINKLDQLPEAE